MAEQDQTQHQPQPELETQPARPPFDVDFFNHCDEFCTGALAHIPELAGIAIVPIWANQPENTPAGFIRSRARPLFIDVMLMLFKRLAAFSMEAHMELIAQLQVYDRYATQLAGEVREKVDQLNALTPTVPQQEPQSDDK